MLFLAFIYIQGVISMEESHTTKRSIQLSYIKDCHTLTLQPEYYTWTSFVWASVT